MRIEDITCTTTGDRTRLAARLVWEDRDREPDTLWYEWPSSFQHDVSRSSARASLPMSTLLGRRAEDELLRTRFPSLARLPLDRNSHIVDPLLGPAVQRSRFADRAKRAFGKLPAERRRYYSLYDINAPVWREVRRVAEPPKRRATDVFDAAKLNVSLPAPDVQIELREPISESNGLKALLGFLVWWQDHG
jgi:asparagine synthase (glutamine-hydrolysing)